MLEAPQLTSVKKEEQKLFSKLFLDEGASHLIFKAEPGHPTEETHFSSLYSGSYSYDHDPALITIG